MRGAAGHAIAMLTALVLTGCTGPAPTVPANGVPTTGVPAAGGPATELPAGVTAVLRQQRSDVIPREVQVQIANGSDEPFTVERITVADPRFAAEIVRVDPDRTTTVRAGGRVNIRMQLPAVACDSGIRPDGDATELTLDHRQGDRTGTAVVAIGEAFPFLGALHRRECDALALAEVADVRLVSFTPSAADAPAELVLRIAPTGAGGAGVLGIHSTNLLTYDGASMIHPIDVDLAPGDTAERMIALPLVPLRCDPHAVLEDKRGTVFTLDVELGGTPTSIELYGGDVLRGDLLAWVSAWCAADHRTG
ncbi:hypothetical protein AOA12_00440 [Microbacterium sp. No. 7]|nr:hypothetical protein AOA12_00440 [Microbacterium sp. No. 7]